MLPSIQSEEGSCREKSSKRSFVTKHAKQSLDFRVELRTWSMQSRTSYFKAWKAKLRFSEHSFGVLLWILRSDLLWNGTMHVLGLCFEVRSFAQPALKLCRCWEAQSFACFEVRSSEALALPWSCLGALMLWCTGSFCAWELWDWDWERWVWESRERWQLCDWGLDVSSFKIRFFHALN